MWPGETSVSRETQNKRQKYSSLRNLNFPFLCQFLHKNVSFFNFRKTKLFQVEKFVRKDKGVRLTSEDLVTDPAGCW